MLESFRSGKFEYKRIPVEEQKKRGILGRLAGVIADTKNPTRNGRLYTKSLWENVFNNDIMKEKIANRLCIGELNHPTDREETDLTKAAICLAEQPKICDDGKIYGVFDILSTPNGRILKSLCDYGCNIGVSSRGSGDLYTDEDGNEAVDPDTYNCECWDAVIVPAVEAARLQYVTEALDVKKYNKTLREKLSEELSNASEDDRTIMKESLSELNINLEESTSSEILSESDEVVNDKALDAVKDDFAPPVDMIEAEEELEEKFYLRHEDIDKARDALLNKVDHEELLNALLAKNMKDQTIEDLCRQFGIEDKEFGYNIMTPDEMEAEFGTRDISDLVKDESINENLEEVIADKIQNELDLDADTRDKCYDDLMSKDIDGDIYNQCSNDLQKEIDLILSNESISESCGDKEEEINEEAGNAGDELVSQLQEALLKSKKLEEDNLALQEKLSVCNAKEVKLGEELKKHKAALVGLSETAKEVKSLKEDVANLKESLEEKNKLVDSGKERISKLVESKHSLSKELEAKKAEIEKLSSEKDHLSESLKDAKTKLDKSTSTIKRYQGALKESRDALVEFKASSCGLKKEEVLSKLTESFNLKEVDLVCEELTGMKRKMSKLPFRITESTKINVKPSNESISRVQMAVDSDDEVSDYLYSMIK